jgi:proteasome accessory factor B
MQDDPSLRRQWNLIRALAARRIGLTVREMATECGVAEKTIRRDLETFRAVGFPVEETVGEFGRKTYRIANACHEAALHFNFAEALALYLGRRLLDPLAGTPLGDGAQSAFKKIRSALTKSALDYLDRFATIVHHRAFGARDYSGKRDLIDALYLAIEESKAVHILYQSDRATEPAYRDVYPYSVVYHQHRSALYLIALDPQEDKIKHYKIDRIEDVEVSSFPFKRPSDFDPVQYLAQSFGVYVTDGEPVRIQVRFAPPVVRYVRECEWHASQKLTPQRDGSLIAEYELSNTAEFKTWILSFGANATVLGPDELREEMAREVDALARAYGVGAHAKTGRLRTGPAP